ncbi:hypothetical protein RB595_000140 [Gaeumannomyces hyphopodioides]
MGEVEPPFRAATPKRKRDHLSHDGSPRPTSCRGTPTAAPAAHPILPPATITNSHTSFSFEVPAYEGDDGSSSPRTRVARKFQGLALDGGGGAPGAKASSLTPTAGATTAAETQPATVPRTHYAGSPTPRRVATAAMMYDSGAHGDDDDDGDDDENGDGYFSARKRFKAPQRAESDSPPSHTRSVFTPVDDTSMGEWAARLQAAGALGDPAKKHSGSATVVGSSGGTYNKTHHRNYKTVGLSPRAATPPLVGAKTTATGEAHEAAGGNEGSPSPPSLSPSPSHKEIVDPVRAALTWHEDEITVYDPDDEDDDGTGINGIGFKPTPAIAYARTLRRRQQLAEYRKREEREARARRTLRRRGSPAVSGSGAASTEGGGGAGGIGVGGSSGSGVAKSAEQQQRQAARRQQLAARRVRFLDVEPAAVITT